MPDVGGAEVAEYAGCAVWGAWEVVSIWWHVLKALNTRPLSPLVPRNFDLT